MIYRKHTGNLVSGRRADQSDVASIDRPIRFGSRVLAACAASSLLGATTLWLPARTEVTAPLTVIGDATPLTSPHAGTVVNLHVSAGDRVAAGSTIATLRDDNRTSTIAALSLRVFDLDVHAARLVAERDGLDRFNTPPTNDELGKSNAVTMQTAQLTARRAERRWAAEALQQTIAGIDTQLDAASQRLTAQIKERDRNERDLANVRPTFNKGDFSLARMGELERLSVRLHGDVATSKTAIARLKAERATAVAALADGDAAFRNRAVTELEEVRQQVRDAHAALAAARSTPEVTKLVSPNSGRIVLGSAIAVGQSVGRGGIVARIVPDSRRLSIAIDALGSGGEQLRSGSRVEVRLSAHGGTTASHERPVSETDIRTTGIVANAESDLSQLQIDVGPDALMAIDPAHHPSSGDLADVMIPSPRNSAAHDAIQPLFAVFARR